MGQKAVPTKWSEPPSGNSVAIVRPPTTAGPPSASAARQSAGTGDGSRCIRAPASIATAETHRNTPATGLAHTLASDSRAAPRRERRAHAQAPTASAIPSVNGIRPITTLLITPPRNSHAASAPAAGVGAMRLASTPNSPTAATPATTPTRRVPPTAASGGYSSE
jgi:hypothetical protein